MQDTTLQLSDKRERFIRLAEARTNRAIKSIRLIRNLTNRYIYDYSVDELELIIKSLRSEVDELQNAVLRKNASALEFRLNNEVTANLI
jgi:uncharacterized protein YeeX (DUF496 family)